jgi:hypothetical protein
MGTNTYGYQYVWVPIYMGTNTYGYQYVWVSICMGTNMYGYQYIWVPVCMGTSMYGYQYFDLKGRSFHSFMQRCMGRDSSVDITTRYGLDGPGIESRWGEILHTRPDRPWCPPCLLCNGYRVFPGGKAAVCIALPLHTPT